MCVRVGQQLVVGEGTLGARPGESQPHFKPHSPWPNGAEFPPASGLVYKSEFYLEELLPLPAALEILSWCPRAWTLRSERGRDLLKATQQESG